MSKYVAFLRAINVGGHTVKMDLLRRLFAEMGFDNVETFIASGNVIFDSTDTNLKELERQIENSLRKALGYEVATFVRSLSELAAVAQYKPFAEADLNGEGHALYIAFVAETPGDESIQKLLTFTTAMDAFHVWGGEIYWLCRHKMSDSKFSGTVLEKLLKMPATLRNITTVRKIVTKYTAQTP